MTFRRSNARPGFSFVELLVVIGLIGVLISLAAVAAHKVRSGQDRTQCDCNLRMIAIATHDYHDTYKRFPPGSGWAPSGAKNAREQGTAVGNVFFHILPYVASSPLYASTRQNGGFYDSYAGKPNPLWQEPFRFYVCPRDPSVGPDGMSVNAPGWAAGCYAFNFQVFCHGGDWNFIGNLFELCKDGTSQTIMFTEKSAACGKFGTLWDRRDGDLWTPVFACWATGSPHAVFQDRPDPWSNDCNPTRASSSHPGYILVAMGDASVKTVRATIDPALWWAACTPDGNDGPHGEFGE